MTLYTITNLPKQFVCHIQPNLLHLDVEEQLFTTLILEQVMKHLQATFEINILVWKLFYVDDPIWSKSPINNKPALSQMMARCRTGDKSSSTNDGLLYWRTYVSLCLGEFNSRPNLTYKWLSRPGDIYLLSDNPYAYQEIIMLLKDMNVHSFIIPVSFRVLTHSGRVTHICVNKLCHPSFR